MSTEAYQPVHSPSQNPTRPKGILKNSNSYQLSSPNLAQSNSPTHTSPTATGFLEQDPISLTSTSSSHRPSLPHQQSEKEIVLHNTLANAGPRRNSSNARSVSRRQSRATNEMDVDDNSPRLKWDEANLYLNEQERPVTMKIDEPKTPFVKQSDLPDDVDDEEVAAINPTGLNVDELDKAKDQPGSHRGRGSVKVGAATSGGTDIPDLDIGESDNVGAQNMMRTESSEKRVVVDPTAVNEDGDSVREDVRTASEEARAKHRQFEEKRKRHYEVPPGALGHSNLDDEDEDEDSDSRIVPPVPSLPPQ